MCAAKRPEMAARTTRVSVVLPRRVGLAQGPNHSKTSPRAEENSGMLCLGASAGALSLRGSGCRNLAPTGAFVNKPQPFSLASYPDFAFAELDAHNKAKASVLYAGSRGELAGTNSKPLSCKCCR